MTQTELAESLFLVLTMKDPQDPRRNAQAAIKAAQIFAFESAETVNVGTVEPTLPRATIRTVLWALNKLKAAPGQPNRDLVRKFLYMKQWIGHIETPEDWNLDHVPTTQEAIIQLVSDVREFDIAQHKPVTPEP